MLKNNKVLITGATGFIGANLAKYFLRSGFDVHALQRQRSDTWRLADILKDMRLHKVDLTNKTGLKRIVARIKPDFIIHGAAYGGYPSQKDAQEIIAVNFFGMVNLFNACRDVDFKLFVNTGSSSEYGEKISSIKESDPLEPITDYGVSKAAAALYVSAQFIKESRPVVTLRLFSPYGYYEGSDRLIPSVILSCLKNKSPRLSLPGYVRDFIFIEDVVEAFGSAVRSHKVIQGEVFNIGSGKQHSIRDIVSIIARLTGCKVHPVWGAVENRRIEPKHWQADMAKAKKVLKWQPRFSLEEGLARTIDWFKKYEGI